MFLIVCNLYFCSERARNYKKSGSNPVPCIICEHWIGWYKGWWLCIMHCSLSTYPESGASCPPLLPNVSSVEALIKHPTDEMVEYWTCIRRRSSLSCEKVRLTSWISTAPQLMIIPTPPTSWCHQVSIYQQLDLLWSMCYIDIFYHSLVHWNLTRAMTTNISQRRMESVALDWLVVAEVCSM